MKVFKTKDKGVEYVEIHPFKLEKEIQELVEKNSETFFYEKNSEKISKNITYRYSNKKLFSHSCPKY
jgi:hypothetical protein